MDGSAFRNFNFDWLFSWWMIAIFCAGLLSILGTIGLGLWWVISHLAWVS